MASTLEVTNPALKDSLAALAGQPTADNHRRVASEYLRSQVTDVAADHFSAAIALDPRDAASYEMRARIWRDWGFPQNGLADAHRAVFFAPASPASHNTLGTLLQRLHRYAEARAEYQSTLRLDPAAAYARVNLCTLDVLEDLPAQAIESCGQALAVNGESVIARRNLELTRNLLTVAAAEAQNDRH